MHKAFPANPLEKPGYRLEFHDEFDGESVDESKWICSHLPQWSSARQAAANARFESGHLVLSIEADQQAWCPEYDGDVRVSSLQTGVFSGPLGSTRGQHRFNRESIVREVQENRAIYTPTYGYFETRLKGVKTPGNHVALWMIGYEDAPENSSEICICEIFGKHVTAESSKIGVGVHPFGDLRIKDDFREVELPIDISEFHVYAAEWTPTHIDFFVDNQLIRTVHQSPDYPMQFMLGIYERPKETLRQAAGEASPYPKNFVVDYVRAYQPVDGYR
ncbi:glycoside hydrolase family 16 protein [Noviherbaspirillum aerium]|uniref:glycoside hydrolase family 16 protein n=1 Tax=Noviherbaspirillum aerium TaxID=2588497 RepID=UPI00124F3B7C|nr:glycoside hydrolase family 16 protein [Noviherbaspirillum aerium]